MNQNIKINNKYYNNLYGPISFYILKPCVNNLPLIILFGDIHNNDNPSDINNNSFNIKTNLLNELEDFCLKNNIKLDFFAEYGNELLDDFSKTTSQLFKHLIYDNINCFHNLDCKYKFINFHQCDLRFINNNDNLEDDLSDDLINYNNREDIIKNIEYKNRDNLNNIYNKLLNNNKILKQYTIDKFNKNNFYDKIKNELVSLHVKFVNEFINNKDVDNNIIFNLMNTILVDIYYILNIYNPNIKISIGLFGAYHVYNIQRTLTQLKLYDYICKIDNVKYENFNEDDNIKNIIKFNKFIDLDKIIIDYINNSYK